MFSKASWLKATTIVVLATSVLTGCDSKVGEDPPPPSSYELGNTQCLSRMKPVIENFVKGDAKNAELESAWSCVSSAVETFKRYVRGNSSDRYTPKNWRLFCKRIFLKKMPSLFRVELQVEFMKIKQIFVGGSADAITRDEIDKLIVLFKNLRDMTVALNPYMKVLSMNWSVSEINNLQADVRYFEDANKEIQNAARLLASLIEKNSQSYQLFDFTVLVKEMGVFFGEDCGFCEDD